MQEWEYLEVWVDGRRWEDSEGREGDLNSRGYATARLNELGAQGWELAGVASANAGEYTLFLKRPQRRGG